MWPLFIGVLIEHVPQIEFVGRREIPYRKVWHDDDEAMLLAERTPVVEIATGFAREALSVRLKPQSLADYFTNNS